MFLLVGSIQPYLSWIFSGSKCIHSKYVILDQWSVLAGFDILNIAISDIGYNKNTYISTPLDMTDVSTADFCD